jgi:hypothetical protein
MRARRDRGLIHNGMRMKTHDHEFDLLTAALMGLTLGVAATLLLHRGASGRRPISAGLSAAGRGAQWAGLAGLAGAKLAGGAMARGTRRGVERGAELVDELPLDDISERIGDYLHAAKGAIEDTVMGELQDLRKAVRRQRKRLGI